MGSNGREKRKKSLVAMSSFKGKTQMKLLTPRGNPADI